MAEPTIYCPKCEWHPTGEDLWECVPSCGTIWNTFLTGGHCPGCGHQWHETQCLDCDRYSPHKTWYHYPNPPADETARDEVVAQVEPVVPADAHDVA